MCEIGSYSSQDKPNQPTLKYLNKTRLCLMTFYDWRIWRVWRVWRGV